jgi:hypothetical protein
MRGETKSLGLLDTADNCWATFINKVKANLHVAFTASPVGEAFRVRSQVSPPNMHWPARACGGKCTSRLLALAAWCTNWCRAGQVLVDSED